jgi:hypothetical protein
LDLKVSAWPRDQCFEFENIIAKQLAILTTNTAFWGAAVAQR